MKAKRSIIMIRARDKRRQQEEHEHELYKAWAYDPRRQDSMEWIKPLIEEDGSE